MNVHVEVSIEFDDNETQIEFPEDGITSTAATKKVGERLYQLESIPIMVDSVKYKDIIEADELSKGRLRFCRVAKSSNWVIYDFILTESKIESPEIQRLLLRVNNIGGHWERIFGGCLYVCLPSTINWNPTSEIIG